MNIIKSSKYLILSGVVAFVLTQIVSTPYDSLIAGFWLGFWGGIALKNWKGHLLQDE